MGEAPAKDPWLTIVGLGEDGLDGLPSASRDALARAEVVMGAKRHIALLPDLNAETIIWPVPFSDGLPVLAGLRGTPTVVLASGDPFWFGAGSVIAQAFEPSEWVAVPGPSTFSLTAARLGWPLERVVCLGLHAAPFQRLRPYLQRGARLILLLRDGAAVPSLCAYLRDMGFDQGSMTVCEALGGPSERVTRLSVAEAEKGDFSHPVCVALDLDGTGSALPQTSGLDDGFFETDGQITKRPIRALALSALAPKPFETLWDIGGGSGSIAIEWLLAHPMTQAVSIEPRPDRAARIRANADQLGVDRLQIVEGPAPEALEDLDLPDAVFIGGGLSDALLQDLTARLKGGTRVVAHGVTLETEMLLSAWSDKLGGSLLRIELSEASPLGSKRGWKGSYPIVQWRVDL